MHFLFVNMKPSRLTIWALKLNALYKARNSLVKGSYQTEQNGATQDMRETSNGKVLPLLYHTVTYIN